MPPKQSPSPAMDYRAALMKPKPIIKLQHMSLDDDSNHNWPYLPPDLMVLIMQCIDWYDVLLNVKEVCKYWYILSTKTPSIWRFIEFRPDILIEKLKYYREARLLENLMENKARLDYIEYEKKVNRIVNTALHKMVMNVIHLSRGQLQDLCINDFGNDHLFKYIYRRSRQLKRLRLEDCFVCCYDYDSMQHDRDITLKGLVKMLQNLPLLEELELSYTRIFGKGIEIVGRHCRHLKSFTLNQRVSRNPECDKQALAIAKSMPGLRRLQVVGNRMTITGLMAILNNCHHLEYLDLRQCYSLCEVLEEPELETKLGQQIKQVRFPRDSIEDYECFYSLYDSDGHIGSDHSSELD